MKKCAVVLIVGFCFISQAIAGNYAIADLGDVQLAGINNNGQVAGISDGTLFTYNNGAKTLINIGTVQVLGINDSGQILINRLQYENGYPYKAYSIYDKGNLKCIATYWPDDYGYGGPMAFNNNGQAVYVYHNDLRLYDNGNTAIIWHLDNAYRYSLFNGTLSLNDNGQVAGTYTQLYGDWYPGGTMGFIADKSNANSIIFSTSLTGINNNGEYIGQMTVAGKSCAFVYANQSKTTLVLPGASSSTATAINDNGQVVGDSLGTAFLFDNGVTMDLNTLLGSSSWRLTSAFDINNQGQIIGQGYHDGAFTSYLLTPIPEPMTALVLGTGSVLMLIRRRKND